MTTWNARVSKRRGVIVDDHHGGLHILTGINENVRQGDEVNFSMDTGPWTDDWEFRGTVVGLVAKCDWGEEPD